MSSRDPAGRQAPRGAPRAPEYDASFDDPKLAELKRPAKPEEDLVSYVRQLQIPLGDLAGVVAAVGAGAGGKHHTLSPTQSALVGTCYREVSKREASLATHKRASQVLESLLRCSPPSRLADAAGALNQYLPFCACNRFSSHTIETLLGLLRVQLAGDGPYVLEEADSGEADSGATAEGLTPACTAALVGASLACCGELTAHCALLLSDTSGTHVLRALACLLSGVPEVPRVKDGERPGAGGGAPFSAPPPAAAGGGGGEAPLDVNSFTVMRRASKAFYRRVGPETAASFRAALTALVQAVVGGVGADADARLFLLACDAHASPTLQLLLRVSSIAASDVGRWLARRLLCMGGGAEPAAPPTGGASRKRARETAAATDPVEPVPAGCTFDDLAGHLVGSRVVEAVLEAAGEVDPPLLASLWTGCLQARLADMCAHPTANFVVQRLLGVASGGVLVEAVREILPGIEGGDLMALKREGVVLHALAAVGRSGDVALTEEVLRAVVGVGGGKGGGTLVTWWLDVDGCRASGESPPPRWGECTSGPVPPVLLSLVPIRVSPLGCRVLTGACATPSGVAAVADALHCLDDATLGRLISDASVSKHLLEPLLSHPACGRLHARLVTALCARSQVAALAASRSGGWVVAAVYNAAVPDVRVKLAEALAAGVKAGVSLEASPGGRKVAGIFRLSFFLANPGAWRAHLHAGSGGGARGPPPPPVGKPRQEGRAAAGRKG